MVLVNERRETFALERPALGGAEYVPSALGFDIRKDGRARVENEGQGVCSPSVHENCTVVPTCIEWALSMADTVPAR
jgi:hypothetical protein